jgi:hypothetical protein
MATYATLDDLREKYEGEITEAAEALATARLGEAQRLVEAKVREVGWTLDGLLTAGRTTVADITDVVCGMVSRVMRNPTGATSQSTGPFSVSVDPATASGKLWLTRDDRSRLGLRRRTGGSAELVDDALPYVLRHPGRACPPEAWPE